MNKKVHEKLVMYKTVQEVLSSNAPAWEGIPAMVSTIATFNEKLILLQELSLTVLTSTSGVRLLKDQNKKETIDLALKVAGGLRAYAAMNQQIELFAQLKFSETNLRRSRRTVLMTYLDVILSNGFEHLSAISAFGISELDLQELQSKRNALNTQLFSTRTAIIGRKAVGHEIEQLVAQIDFLLKNGIDPLMVVLKMDHASIYELYLSGRIIVEIGKRKQSVDPPTEPDDGL